MQTEKYCEFQAKVSFFSYFKFVTKIFVSEISKDLTWGTQGREEGRWVSVSNDCCCEDSTGAADYSTDLVTQPRSSICDGMKRSEVKMVGGDYTMK